MRLNVRTVDLKSWGVVEVNYLVDGHRHYEMRGIEGSKFAGKVGRGTTRQSAFDELRGVA